MAEPEWSSGEAKLHDAMVELCCKIVKRLESLDDPSVEDPMR